MKNDEILEQVAQRGLEVSVLGDSQNLTRQHPKQSDLTSVDPALSRNSEVTTKVHYHSQPKSFY